MTANDPALVTDCCNSQL